ncbi:MAG: HD-GYP domain-containing protein [Acidobacteria bacterium]|nr:HD-GYP domain-containing protein [Acidobacteriota bacterium]
MRRDHHHTSNDRDTKFRVGILAGSIILITLFHYTTGVGAHVQHAFHLFLRMAYMVPLIAAAIWFGMRGFFFTVIPICIFYGTHVAIQWQGQVAENMNQIVTLLTYVVIGLVSALLAQQVESQREARHRVERSRRRDLLLSAVENFSSALRWRDDQTERHCEQVAQLAEALAKKAGLSADRIELARLGGLLHDIGKIGVRDDILLKNGDLNEKERSHIHRHPVVAYEMIRHIEGAEDLAEVVLSHHEQLDGSGYPRGLKGNEIPFEAQIVSVADVYSALTEDRPYHSGMADDQALAYMHETRGNHLDGHLVDLLQSLVLPHKEMGDDVWIADSSD